QSINSAFGSGVTAGDTGILLNNRMSPWHLEPGHPNRLQPGRRARHTMNPPVGLKAGDLRGVFRSPRGSHHVQLNPQALAATIARGCDPHAAAELPRWSSTQPGQEANYPRACPEALNLEARFPTDVREDLAGRGHPVVVLGDLDGPCSVEIIRRDAETGMLMAGSDPRRDGWALAW